MTKTLNSCVLLFTLLAAATPLLATSYVPMHDEDLLAQTPLVVTGEVTAASETRTATGLYTDYAVSTERILKGRLSVSSITVRVPGSLSPDRGLRLYGMPRYQAGERGAWFLAPRADGTFGIMQLMLGAFHERSTIDGERVLERDLDEATMISSGPQTVYDGPRARAAFLRWIELRNAGRAAPQNYFTDPDKVLRVPMSEFSYISSDQPRWFNFDKGRAVVWKAGSGGYRKPNGSQTGVASFKSALLAWNNDPNTNINYQFGAEVNNPTFTCDGSNTVNVMIWDDPRGEISGSFSCKSGGVLAVGGPCYGGTAKYQGRAHPKIFNARVITQDGAGCYFEGHGGKDGIETLTHEVGHTLGLGHSCGDSATGNCNDKAKNDAVMRATIHGDGRGAALKADDLAGIRTLYATPAAR